MSDVAESALCGTWLEEGAALSSAARWRFLDDGTFTYAREHHGASQYRHGTFRVEMRGEQALLRLWHQETSSVIPVRLNGARLEMLVRADGENIVRVFHRANTCNATLVALTREIVGRWERADTRHDEMIGEFYEFADDGTFTRVEGFHRNLAGERTTTFEQLSVRSGSYFLELTPNGVMLAFELDGALRPAGIVRLNGNELTLEGPRPLRLLRRVIGAAFRRRQEAR